MNTPNDPIAIFGAGSIGCYVGGILNRAGCDIRFIGREKTGDLVTQTGMTLSALDRDPVFVAGKDINWHTNPEALTGCKTVLLCTKSTDTLSSAKLIKKHCDKGSVVVSLQNGVGNAELLREKLGDMTVLSAVVSFNVARIEGASLRFHRGTDGEIIFQKHEITQQLSHLLSDNGLQAQSVVEMEPIVWGKLMMNLNNAVNAISGLPLKRQLQNRDWRHIYAASVKEALSVLKLASIKPAKIGRVPPALIPGILSLPNFAFNIIARSMLKIDENARSSMWEDLQAGRKPEIDYLNGAICDLGRKLNVPTPVNDLMTNLVKQRFADGSSAIITAREVLNMIERTVEQKDHVVT